MIKSILITCLLLGNLYSGPARSIHKVFKQINGTSFEGKLKGDEHFSWIELKNGDIAVYNEASKLYEYAEFKTIDDKLELRASGTYIGSKKSSVAGKKNISIQSNSKQSFDVSAQKFNLSQIWKRKRQEKLNK